MSKSTFFRYLPARLRPLGKPAVWVPLAALVLIGAFLLEYQRNPDWFDRRPGSNLTPESRLTAEEEARLAEIDTLDVLLDGSRVSEDTPPVTSQINPDAPIDTDAEGSSDDESDELSLQEQYPIPGTASTDTTLQPGRSSLFSSPSALPGRSSASESSSGTTFNFGDSLVDPAAPSNNSALAEALNRRESARLSGQESGSAAPSDTNASSPASPTSPGADAGTSQAVPSAQPVPGSFIRTTPEMSPPVGTTGYQAPATSDLSIFNTRPQQPTPNPYNTAPTNQSTNQSSSRGVAPAPIGQAAPAPASVAPPAIAAPSAAATAPGSTSPTGSLYTVPSSVQPDQGRPINPRR